MQTSKAMISLLTVVLQVNGTRRGRLSGKLTSSTFCLDYIAHRCGEWCCEWDYYLLFCSKFWLQALGMHRILYSQFIYCTSDDQHHDALAVLSGGDFIVVWASTSGDGSHEGIYGQRYSSSGDAANSEFLVDTRTTFSQTYPPLSNGGLR